MTALVSLARGRGATAHAHALKALSKLACVPALCVAMRRAGAVELLIALDTDRQADALRFTGEGGRLTLTVARLRRIFKGRGAEPPFFLQLTRKRARAICIFLHANLAFHSVIPRWTKKKASKVLANLLEGERRA